MILFEIENYCHNNINEGNIKVMGIILGANFQADSQVGPYIKNQMLSHQVIIVYLKIVKVSHGFNLMLKEVIKKLHGQFSNY